MNFGALAVRFSNEVHYKSLPPQQELEVLREERPFWQDCFCDIYTLRDVYTMQIKFWNRFFQFLKNNVAL